ncbi:hypothetical protein Q9R19_10405 [Microbacterium sp. ARD32]|uniref:hypothetical protein n=1 Tax=Microbacterium sp. ARD32 TaxID=2962577 RepID=UPI002880F1FB|nr:hypothetical protein [Microbacterium sp. ARD32]MDT0158034.1 hypothetical protein [Microbacterium sp. ARD32]
MARATALQVGDIPQVNLLPRSEFERRERERLTGVWGRAVIATLMLTTALIGGAYAWNLYTQQGLTGEQERTTALIGEIGELSEVSRTLQTERDLIAYRADAMGSDLGWTAVLDRISGALPADVQLVGFDLTVGAVPQGGGADAEAAKEAAQQAVGLTGTITLASPTPREMAPYARALRAVEGVAGADASSVATSGADGYLYTIDITFDQTVYSGSFAEKKEADR